MVEFFICCPNFASRHFYRHPPNRHSRTGFSATQLRLTSERKMLQSKLSPYRVTNILTYDLLSWRIVKCFEINITLPFAMTVLCDNFSRCAAGVHRILGEKWYKALSLIIFLHIDLRCIGFLDAYSVSSAPGLTTIAKS